MNISGAEEEHDPEKEHDVSEKKGPVPTTFEYIRFDHPMLAPNVYSLNHFTGVQQKTTTTIFG